MKHVAVALGGALLGAVIILGLLFALPTQVSQDYDRCVEARMMHDYDNPPPCWVAVLTID